MADSDKRNRDRYLRAGYAAPGYQKRQRSDGNLHSGPGTANLIIRGTVRA